MNKRSEVTRVLPRGHSVVSKDGYAFDPGASHWRLNKDVVVALGRAASLPEPTQSGFRATLRRYAEEMSADHTYNMASKFHRYLRDTGAQSVNITNLLNWRAQLGASHQDMLGGLRGFLISWHGYGFPGVSSDVVDLLRGLRLKGNEKGVAVATSDPRSGPFTDIEVLGLLDWANVAVVRRQIEFADYAYALALAMTARRPVQIAALRGKDLTAKSHDGNSEFRLKVPRAKQRGYGFRQVFHSLAIIEDLHRLLSHQHGQSVATIEGWLGAKLDPQLQAEVPIFLNTKARTRIHDLSSLRFLLLGRMPDALHETTASLQSRLVRIRNLSTVKSERTGQALNIFARRFRCTFATNMLRQGFGPFEIAKALDHSDTQSVRVYTENTAQEVVVINQAIGAKLAPFAQACLGRLVESERKAIRGEDPRSRVPNGQQHSVGTCGNYGFCVSGWRSCYTCPLFQPWVEGPHREVLSQLYAEKEEARAAGCAEQVVNAQDRLILAVEHCIALCDEEMQKAVAVEAGASVDG